ncbi:stalk domain-containing protein [Caldisericum exile]|uniref:stalk domain-containing protein n=1 Tax=Caldisericum exile TaxID=693075 RepID=UPI003C771659
MKRFSIIIIALFLMVLSINLNPVRADVEIRNVLVTPSTTDTFAQFAFYIVLHKDLNRGELIYIKFPVGFSIPSSINKDLVEIAGYKPSSVTVSSNIIILTLSEPILQNQGAGTGGVAVTISSSAGIKTPAIPDMYSVEIWTTTEPNHAIYSFYIGVETQGSTVSGLSLILSDNRAGKNSRYDISFTVTMGGALIPGDYIDVYFPKGTTLPTTPDLSKVLINLASPSVVNVQERRVRVYIPEDRFIAPGATCTIFFLQEFGIINPEFTGNFAIQVATSKDTGIATSNIYTIYGSSILGLNANADPSSQKMNASYSIEFKTSPLGALTKDKDKINIKFADTFTFPQTAIPGAITVNGTPCTNVTISENKLTLYVPLSIDANANVKIVITKQFGIVNPQSVGNYEVFVNTSADAVFISTNISITPSTITSPLVQLSNTSSGQASAYTIFFRTGASGNLLPGIDRINIVFPLGTTIPTTIPTSQITINDVPTTLVEISGTTLTITLPIEIKEFSNVIVRILEGANIKNPVQAGNYSLSVFTTKEQTPMVSNSYKIENVPETKVTLSPEKPNGMNEFYKTPPSITFSVFSAIDPNPTVYYYFDTNSPVVWNGSPIIAPEGIHTLFYYAVDREGHKEAVKSLQIKVDTIPPTVVVLEPKDNSVVSSRIVKIKGIVDAGSTITINGVSAFVDGSGNFEANFEMKENLEMISIVATDIAGNASEVKVKLTLDTEPPSLTILKPIMFENIIKLPLVVEGMTEKGATITVNGEKATVRDDAYFICKLYNLKENALNNIEVIATDAAGNSTKKVVIVRYSKSISMILQIGNTVAVVNGQNYTLEVVPQINSGRTMVPLRFIGESFGATFTYEASTKKIDISFNDNSITMWIGKKKAFVNGKEIQIDVAPFVVNGRTLVPIRFISDVFGADVIWNSQTKTVLIIYPKQ